MNYLIYGTSYNLVEEEIKKIVAGKETEKYSLEDISIKELLEKYINNYEAKNTSNKNGLDEKELYDEYSVISSKEPLGKIIERFEMLNIESVERYIYYFLEKYLLTYGRISAPISKQAVFCFFIIYYSSFLYFLFIFFLLFQLFY